MRNFFDKTRIKLIILCCITLLISGVLIGFTQFYNNVKATSWGLGYPNNGSEPYVSIDEEVFSKYQAYYRGDKTKKNIYLTFDAGYDNGNTELILNVLKEYNVKGTFFLAGYFLESHPDLVKRMVEEGHTVGNHTLNHKNMSSLDKSSFIKEIKDFEELYSEVVGSPVAKFYRPPEGRYNENNLMWANELGYKTIFWSLTHKDWDTNNQPGTKESISILTKRIHNGAIILMHSVSSTNAQILGELIEDYVNLGYKIRPITTLGKTNYSITD